MAEEQTGKGGRRMLYASRLLRDQERYVARFGRRPTSSCLVTVCCTSTG
jgi:hypothetical protein